MGRNGLLDSGYHAASGVRTSTKGLSLSSGLRAWKTNSSGTTYYLYDGSTPVVELDGIGSVAATNTFGPNGLLSRHTSGGSTFYTFDLSGGVAQRLDFEPERPDLAHARRLRRRGVERLDERSVYRPRRAGRLLHRLRNRPPASRPPLLRPIAGPLPKPRPDRSSWRGESVCVRYEQSRIRRRSRGHQSDRQATLCDPRAAPKSVPSL